VLLPLITMKTSQYAVLSAWYASFHLIFSMTLTVGTIIISKLHIWKKRSLSNNFNFYV
jgi:hypothetical protein